MGGIDFASLITSIRCRSAESLLEINFQKESYYIYQVTSDVFVDPTQSDPGVIFDSSTHKVTYCDYDVSSETVEGIDCTTGSGTHSVNYVTKMYVPVSELPVDFYLYVYVNCSIMGVQFCDSSGTSGSNTPDTFTPYSFLVQVSADVLG